MGDKHCNKWKWKTDLMTFSLLSSWQIHLSFVKYVIIEAIEDYSCSNLPPQKELKSEIRPNNRIRFKIYYLINTQGLTCNQAFRDASRISKVDRKWSQNRSYMRTLWKVVEISSQVKAIIVRCGYKDILANMSKCFGART